jgi:type VI secretion system lysozyme-related protein
MSFWNRIKEASKETKTIVKKSESEIISELIRSIKKNIELVLNSKQGCTL